MNHPPPPNIDVKIQALNDWRGKMPAKVRALIRWAVLDMVEVVKGRGDSV